MTEKMPDVICPGEYTTRDGRKAVVLTCDAPDHEFPVIGYFVMRSTEPSLSRATQWRRNGMMRTEAAEFLDLVARRPAPSTPSDDSIHAEFGPDAEAAHRFTGKDGT